MCVCCVLGASSQLHPVLVLHTLHRYYFPRKAHHTSQSQTPVSPIGADHLGTQHRSHDRAMTSSPAKGISQLPDVFPGVCALLCGCGQEERALTRYIVAYGGDTCSCVEEGPTHIVCGNDRDLPQVCLYSVSRLSCHSIAVMVFFTITHFKLGLKVDSHGTLWRYKHMLPDLKLEIFKIWHKVVVNCKTCLWQFSKSSSVINGVVQYAAIVLFPTTPCLYTFGSVLIITGDMPVFSSL